MYTMYALTLQLLLAVSYFGPSWPMYTAANCRRTLVVLNVCRLIRVVGLVVFQGGNMPSLLDHSRFARQLVS